RSGRGRQGRGWPPEGAATGTAWTGGVLRRPGRVFSDTPGGCLAMGGGLLLAGILGRLPPLRRHRLHSKSRTVPMARGINKAILVGNLGNDPETRYPRGGRAVTKISLATPSVRKDRDGNPQENTQWHRVAVSGQLGGIAGECLRKGSQVAGEGESRSGEDSGPD